MKKLLATLLASAMALTAMGGLAACGDDQPTFKVWAPSESIDTYKALAKEFQKENSEFAKYKITFEPVEEGKVQTNMGKDPSTGAAVFFFPSDHIYKLYKSNILQPLVEANGKDYAAIVRARDEQEVYEFATINNELLAFPATNDNGLFFLYDSEKLTATEAASLDTMQDIARESKKQIIFDYGDVYTSASFFIGTGCTFGYKDHTMAEYHTTLDSAGGVAATKAYVKYFDAARNTYTVTDSVTQQTTTENVLSNSNLGIGFANGSAIAGVAGTWTWTSIKKAMEAKGKKTDKIVATTLPSFEVDGQPYDLGTFYGAKYCGVNRQIKDRNILKAALALAEYFTSEKGQLARYEATFSGPSNLNAQQDTTIATDARLLAYKAQKEKCGHIQYDQSGDFWSPSGFGNLMNKIATGNIKDDDHPNETTEQAALRVLKTLAASLEQPAKK